MCSVGISYSFFEALVFDRQRYTLEQKRSHADVQVVLAKAVERTNLTPPYPWSVCNPVKYNTPKPLLPAARKIKLFAWLINVAMRIVLSEEHVKSNSVETT